MAVQIPYSDSSKVLTKSDMQGISKKFARDNKNTLQI